MNDLLLFFLPSTPSILVDMYVHRFNRRIRRPARANGRSAMDVSIQLVNTKMRADIDNWTESRINNKKVTYGTQTKG
jgi:hypothetical protein